MRRANKQAIKQTLVEFEKFTAICNERSSKVQVPGLGEYVHPTLNTIRERIENGEIGYCLQAMVDNLKRVIIRSEKGEFESIDKSCFKLTR